MNESKFKIGERILVLDDDFGGVVVFAKAEQITILSDDNIEITYHESELILNQRFKVDTVIIKEETTVQKGRQRLVSFLNSSFFYCSKRKAKTGFS